MTITRTCRGVNFYHDNASHQAEVNGQKYNVFISSYLHKGKSNTLHYTELSTTLVISRIRDTAMETMKRCENTFPGAWDDSITGQPFDHRQASFDVCSGPD